MSIVAFLFKRKGERSVVAGPLRSDCRAPAPRLARRERGFSEDASFFRAFVSGSCDDALFAPLASLRGLNVAEREWYARAERSEERLRQAEGLPNFAEACF